MHIRKTLLPIIPVRWDHRGSEHGKMRRTRRESHGQMRLRVGETIGPCVMCDQGWMTEDTRTRVVDRSGRLAVPPQRPRAGLRCLR